MANQSNQNQNQNRDDSSGGKAGAQDGQRYGKEPQDQMKAGGPGQDIPRKGEQPQRSHNDQHSQGGGQGKGAGQGWQSQQRSGNR